MHPKAKLSSKISTIGQQPFGKMSLPDFKPEIICSSPRVCRMPPIYAFICVCVIIIEHCFGRFFTLVCLCTFHLHGSNKDKTCVHILFLLHTTATQR